MRSAGCRGIASRARRCACSRVTATPSSRAIGDRRRHDRRARVRQRREADAARRGAAGTRRLRAGPPDRHFVAGARADRAAADALSALLRRRPPVHLRRGSAARGGGARGQRRDARPAPRLESRQLRYAGGRRVPRTDSRARSRRAICCCSARTSSSPNPICCSPTTIRLA